jgi:SAM-dependent methyltransferase
LGTLSTSSMRTTWDALAPAHELYAGDPARGRQELDALFGRLGSDPRGGTCVEVGCGSGRMTVHLAERFDEVVALDVSPAMVETARAAVAASGTGNVRFQVVSGAALDGVADASANTLVCYLVLQHLPDPSLLRGYLAEFARVLAPSGEAFVHLPVLAADLRARAWRSLARKAVPLLARLSRDPARTPAFRGSRPTEAELVGALDGAGLVVTARGRGPDSPYRYSHDVFLRLTRR